MSLFTYSNTVSRKDALKKASMMAMDSDEDCGDLNSGEGEGIRQAVVSVVKSSQKKKRGRLEELDEEIRMSSAKKQNEEKQNTKSKKVAKKDTVPSAGHVTIDLISGNEEEEEEEEELRIERDYGGGDVTAPEVELESERIFHENAMKMLQSKNALRRTSRPTQKMMDLADDEEESLVVSVNLEVPIGEDKKVYAVKIKKTETWRVIARYLCDKFDLVDVDQWLFDGIPLLESASVEDNCLVDGSSIIVVFKEKEEESEELLAEPEKFQICLRDESKKETSMRVAGSNKIASLIRTFQKKFPEYEGENTVIEFDGDIFTLATSSTLEDLGIEEGDLLDIRRKK